MRTLVKICIHFIILMIPISLFSQEVRLKQEGVIMYHDHNIIYFFPMQIDKDKSVIENMFTQDVAIGIMPRGLLIEETGKLLSFDVLINESIPESIDDSIRKFRLAAIELEYRERNEKHLVNEQTLKKRDLFIKIGDNEKEFSYTLKKNFSYKIKVIDLPKD